MVALTALERKAQEVLQQGQKDPVAWTYAVLDRTITQYQADIMYAIRDYTRVSVGSCNSIGKDFAAGCLTLWWIHQWSDAVVVTTAPTWHQVEAIQWKREIHRLYEGATVSLGGRMMNTEYRLSPERVAFGISVNNKEAIQGIHSEHILVIVTEASASEFDDELVEGLDALMAGGHASMLMLSNPTRQEGAFYRSHHSEQDQWHAMRIGAFDTPNLQACEARGQHKIPDECPVVVDGLITHEWVEDMRLKYGEDSDFWRVHVMGQFPKSGSDVIIPMDWIEQAYERGLARY